MKAKKLKILFLFLMAGLLLMGCGGRTPEAEIEAVDEPVSQASPTEEIPATQTATAEPTEEPPQPTDTEIVQPTPTVIIEPTEVADHCTDCHIDKERLIDTADEEEEVVSENEGEG